MYRGTKSRWALWGLFALACTARAEEVKPVEGTFLLGKHTYKLVAGAAYEAKISGEPVTVVVASDRTVPIGTIKQALTEGKDADTKILSQPHLVIIFDKTGAVDHLDAWADNTQIRNPGRDLSGELKIDAGRARGQAKMTAQGEGDFQRSFEFRFDLPFGLDATPKPSARPAGPVKPSVTGTFKGNGKPARLAYVSVRRREPFADKPALLFVFSEKDHSREKQPDFKAGFGEFGSALIISAHEDGQIFGCEVAHSAHAKKPFSSLGSIKTEAFEVGDGKATGRITTDGEQDAFGEKWEVDIQFVAPLAEEAPKPADKAVAGDKPNMPKRASKRPASEPAKPKADKAEAPTSTKASELPFPKSATDVKYKKLVEQITFASPTAVQTLAAEFVKNLDGQGWTSDGSDLITAKSAILKRAHGSANLTIMLRAVGNGSTATIFTEGLDWEE